MVTSGPPSLKIREDDLLHRIRARLDLVTVVMLVLTLGLTVRLGVGVISEVGDSRDAQHYVMAGFSLARHGLFGYHVDDGPNMYREPLTSWTIAAQVLVDPRLRGFDAASDGPTARAVKQQNLVWAALTLFGIGQLALLFLGRRGKRELMVALAAMLVTHVAFLEWYDVVDRSLSELAAAAILIWAAIATIRAIDRPGVRMWATVGALLGLLALTKASFLYVALVFLPMLTLLRWWRAAAPSRTLLRDLGVAVVALAVVCTPWMVRNLVQFDDFGISDRGGLAIWFRVNYNDATPDELRGAWVYFAPGPLQPPVARALGVDLDDFEGDGSLRRVARFAGGDDPEGLSFYRMARADRGRLTDEYRAQGLPDWVASNRADRDLMRWGIEALREDPSRFVRTFPVFLWRGTWSMLYSNLMPSVLLGPLNLVGMVLLMVALVLAVSRGRPRLFAVVGVPGGVIIFYALMTHFEPRQARPAVPVMLLLFVLAADAVLRAVTTRLRPESLSPAQPDRRGRQQRAEQ